MKTFIASQALLARARKVTPGASQTASKAPGRAGPLDNYPLFADVGHGVHISDIDGNMYLDFVAGLAAVGLGHGHRAVTLALAERLSHGTLMSLPTKLEVEASERLCEATGWAEQVRWVKTGSEATEAAIRIARAATGRSRILTVRSGYHSWHSWFQAVKPEHPGVPAQMEALIVGCEYGATYDDWEDIAAVILEPAPITGGGDGDWLGVLVEHARAHGVVVIFDEVVWGFRLALAGGTEYFGVRPDLACYGKALGNGVPIGAVVGRANLMRFANLVSGTFGGDTLGLTAALAVMKTYKTEDTIRRMWERGQQFQNGLNEFGPYDGVSLRCTGYPVHPVISITHRDTQDPAVVMSYFLQRLAQYGVLWHPAGGNIIAAHSERTIREAIDACWLAAREVAKAASERPLAETVTPYQQAFSRATS